MTTNVHHVLFLCTGNSARSIMAEVLMNHAGNGRFKASSAGSHPTGKVNPFALETMQRMGLSVEGLRSKSWYEFAQPGTQKFDFIFTVCDKAAGEACPVWPGRPITAHWGVEDPADSDPTVARKAFHRTALVLKHRIELFVSLPLQKLDTLRLRQQLQAIGED